MQRSKFLDVLDVSGIWGVLGMFVDILECFRTFVDASGYFFERFGMFCSHVPL